MKELDLKRVKTKSLSEEAVQYFDNKFGSDDPFWDWMTADCEFQDPDGIVYGLVLTNTPCGIVEVEDGDWILKDFNGVFHRITDDVFHTLYDIIEE